MSPDVVTAICFVATFLLTAIYLTTKDKPRNENREIIFKDYEEYSSCKTLADRWFNSDLVGECGVCGMDDAPITLPRSEGTIGFLPYTEKCRYCQELANITYHLKHKSVLPWREQKKRYHPELVKKEKSGYYD